MTGCGVRPSGVIGGTEAPHGDAGGTLLFLVSDGAVVPVVRPAGRPGGLPRDPADPFALLAAGPTADERARGLTSEVPAQAVPTDITPDGEDGVTLRLPVDVSELSALAAEQLACTAAPGRPVTLVGGGTSRAPVSCAYAQPGIG